MVKIEALQPGYWVYDNALDNVRFVNMAAFPTDAQLASQAQGMMNAQQAMNQTQNQLNWSNNSTTLLQPRQGLGGLAMTYSQPSNYKVILPKDGKFIVETDGVEREVVTKPIEEKKTMIQSFKDYIAKYKEVLFTVVIALVADQVIFKGAFRKKLHDIVDKLINKATASLGE